MIDACRAAAKARLVRGAGSGEGRHHERGANSLSATATHKEIASRRGLLQRLDRASVRNRYVQVLERISHALRE